jgi:hypothetical protein
VRADLTRRALTFVSAIFVHDNGLEEGTHYLANRRKSVLRLLRHLKARASIKASLAIAFLVIGSGVFAAGSPVKQPHGTNATVDSLSPWPAAQRPQLLTGPSFRTAQRCLGQGEWCANTRECCNGLCCNPDTRSTLAGMCTRRQATTPCIPP